MGSVYIEDGDDCLNGFLMKIWDIPRNTSLQNGPFFQLELDLNRPNAEGFVLLNNDTGDRIKMKQEDYLELHKIMTGLNERQLWEWLSEGKTINEILSDLPEELHDWAEPILNGLVDGYLNMDKEVHDTFIHINNLRHDRKSFAQVAVLHDTWMQSALFLRFDGQDARLSDHIWTQLRP